MTMPSVIHHTHQARVSSDKLISEKLVSYHNLYSVLIFLMNDYKVLPQNNLFVDWHIAVRYSSDALVVLRDRPSRNVDATLQQAAV